MVHNLHVIFLLKAANKFDQFDGRASDHIAARSYFDYYKTIYAIYRIIADVKIKDFCIMSVQSITTLSCQENL